MTAPLLWIGVPIICGLTMLALDRWKAAVAVLAVLIPIGLAAFSWWMPIGETIMVGNRSVLLGEQITVAGNIFIITNSDRLTLVLLYGVVALLFTGGVAAKIERDFLPAVFFLAACTTAALAIEPVFLGAIFVEFGALISVFVLTPPERPVSRGVLRFLIYQTIGVAFLLLSSMALESEQLSANPALLLPFGVGLACVLAIFPLHTWIPMLMEEARPYRTIGVLMMHGSIVVVFLFGVLDRYNVLETHFYVEGILRAVGTLLVVTGGAWAAFQRHLGRIYGYAVVVAIGLFLGNIGLTEAGLQRGLWIPMVFAFILWGLGLNELSKKVKSLQFRDAQGLARAFPLTAAVCLLANFSLAGMPLFAGFPLWMTFWKKLVIISPALALWNYLGSMGLMAGGLRSFAVLVMGPPDLNFQEKEEIFLRWLLLVGFVILFLSGLFPDGWSNALGVMVEGLENLG